MSFELDKDLEKFSTKTKKSVTESYKQVKDLSRSKGIDVSIIASFQNIEKELLSQLEADNVIRLKVRKKFLGLVNSLENNS